MATPVLLPRQGQSVESCILIEWSVSPGDIVDAGDVIGEIETDKATFEVEAPVSGTILELFYEVGADIPVLTNIAAIGEPGEDVSGIRPAGADEPEAAAAPVPGSQATTAVAESETATSGLVVGVSPRARGLAAQNKVVASRLTGTGPGGRVIERDVRAAIEAGIHRVDAGEKAAKDAAPWVDSEFQDVITGPVDQIPLSAPVPAGTEYRDEPLSGIRKIIAGRMLASLSTTAQLTLNRSFDVSKLQGLRKTIKENGEALGLPNITLNDMVVYATAKVLTRHPELNAHFLGDRVRYFDAVHLGVAVDTPRGLMVPVVRNVQQMGLTEVSAAIKPLALAAQSGKINPDHLQGGTFTITNLGTLGIESFTPILNAPEVGILGVCGIILKAVMDTDGSVKHVPSIMLSLTVNHQVVDGSPAARFLDELVTTLESFDQTLLR